MSGTRKGITAGTIMLAVFGGVVLLGTGAAAATTGVFDIGPQAGSTAVEANGIGDLDLEVRGAEVTIEFHDSDRAELRVEQGSLRGWSIRRDGDGLEVRGPHRGFDWWWNPDWLRGEEQRVTLLLPRSAAGLDADLTLDAGSLTANGEFGALSVDMNAGALSLDGSAMSLDAELNAGRADIALEGVREASYRVAAGRVESEPAGDAPASVEVDVSAGALTLTLPDADYDLQRDVSAGTLNSELTERAGSGNEVQVTVSAGTVNLRQD